MHQGGSGSSKGRSALTRPIAIFTSGRFHVCDLARELDSIGYDVSFYSCVPAYRTRRFGLPNHCSKSLFPYLAPLFVLMRHAQNTSFQDYAESIFLKALDALGSRKVGACDVLIGMSGMSSRTAATVRAKYGSQIWIERGSSHILTQRRILSRLPGTRQVSDRAVRRELADYDAADTIVVPSVHVERSFVQNGVPAEKLFRNPYGVDLAMFPVTEKPVNEIPTVLMAGTWSLRKGCDVLWEACRAARSWRLLHVGPIGDAPLPSSPLFIHRDAVPQWKLAEAFKEADVFALASREEGLSVVQAQALACGLPVVCTQQTGGDDLRNELEDKRWVIVTPPDDASAFGHAIEAAIELSQSQMGARNLLGNSRQRLSWEAYGKRYADELEARSNARCRQG